MTTAQRQPTEAEIDAVIHAIEYVSRYIDPRSGRIKGLGWRKVYDTLKALSEYELWIGICNLEDALFGGDNPVTPAQSTLFELFQIAYNNLSVEID